MNKNRQKSYEIRRAILEECRVIPSTYSIAIFFQNKLYGTYSLITKNLYDNLFGTSIFTHMRTRLTIAIWHHNDPY